MAEKKLVEAITSMNEDFAQWYTDVVKKAELIDYSNVKGCMVIKPAGYAIWENIQRQLDDRFKAVGVENVYMPMFIPESLLEKEKDHVEGFAPEVAWVTYGGLNPLPERMCVRPTSETLFCDFYKNDIQSYRDLPKVYNQWCSVVRWEKETRPFLRSREFLWQEGHTIHATYEEAEERTKQMWRVYRDFVQDVLAIPVVSGRKTESEKFAGAQDTYTIEALMHDGKALQSGTSHFFGSAFPNAFGIQYSDKNNELHEVYETSWGMSTRVIGALIMVHGDDSGLVIPPRVAPVQTMVIPIAQHKEGVLDKANELLDTLKAAGYKAKIDDSDKAPGWKFSGQEILGIPTRIEIGPKDIENNQAVIVRRDTREKIVVSLDEITTKLAEVLETMQKDMFEKAKTFLEAHINTATTMDEMNEKFNENLGFIKAMWCGERECEDKLKEDAGITSRCMPLEQEKCNDGNNNNVLGGRFNSYLNYGIIKGEQWLCQKGQDNMDPSKYPYGGDHFVKLCPLWQLLLYYREIVGGEKRDWYGDVAEIVRNTDESQLTNGQLQLNFMRNTMDVVKEDLTDFFIKAGMLKPIDKELDDYARGQMTITQTDCDELVKYASKYSKPATPVLYYLSANSQKSFKDKLAVEGTYNEGVKVRNNGWIVIDHDVWKNAVVFETYQGDELKYAAIVGTDSPDLSETKVCYPEGSTRIEAVSWDGTRTLVYGKK